MKKSEDNKKYIRDRPSPYSFGVVLYGSTMVPWYGPASRSTMVPCPRRKCEESSATFPRVAPARCGLAETIRMLLSFLTSQLALLLPSTPQVPASSTAAAADSLQQAGQLGTR